MFHGQHLELSIIKYHQVVYTRCDTLECMISEEDKGLSEPLFFFNDGS
jgi:hypothetical protein